MNNSRPQWLPIILVLAGVLIVCGCAIAAREELGWWQYGIYAGGLLALVAACLFRRRVTSEQLDLELLKSEIVSRETQLKKDFSQLQSTQQQFEEQVGQQSQRLDKREEDLANKLIAYHEWMEFPQPIDLSAPAVSDAELSEMADKDRQMIALLEEESKQLFDKIRGNEFSVDGKIQWRLMGDDVYALADRVARIYRPDLDQALMETSIAQVMRAASRACLHFLVVLDRLPLNVKEYNINTMYGYVHTALKAYGVYKFASPFLPYLKSAYYLGRYAMGAHPGSMGAWWFAGAISKRGAEALATKVRDHLAVEWLHDVVRVIGFEVAGIYGGGFRHRDANWIYATELTELMSQFPSTHDSLSHALKEIGALQLRSEYDRVYLYRLLSECKSANPAQYRPLVCLTGVERQAVAQRLEKFVNVFMDSATNQDVERWKVGIEERLNLKLRLADEATTLSQSQQCESAVRSLASFLLAVKRMEPSQLNSALANATVMNQWNEDQQKQVLDALENDLPTFFEQPEIELSAELTNQYLCDLIELTASQPPFDEGDEVVLDCAAFLRKKLEDVSQRLDDAYVSRVRQRFPKNGVPKRLPPDVARAVLNLIEPEDEPRFIYQGVSVESPDGNEIDPTSTWLIGISDRMILLGFDVGPIVLWRADDAVEFEDVRQLLSSRCLIRGGQWLDGDAANESCVLSVAGPIIGSYDNYFEMLKALGAK